MSHKTFVFSGWSEKKLSHALESYTKKSLEGELTKIKSKEVNKYWIENFTRNFNGLKLGLYCIILFW